MEELYTLLIVGLVLFLFLAITFSLSIVIYKRRVFKDAEEKSRMQYEFQQQLLKSQLEIQEETLKHISEEIHDNIGQVLSLAKLHLNVLPVPPAPENEQVVLQIKQLVSKAITDLRQLSKSLHTDRIAELGLEESIRQELDILNKSGQFITSLTVNGNMPKLPTQSQTIIFRIVQEGISNILKHAKATRLALIITNTPTRFQLQLTDDGVGFDMQHPNEKTIGIGLRNMQNRSALIGATLQVVSVPNNGTSVSIALPIN